MAVLAPSHMRSTCRGLSGAAAVCALNSTPLLWLRRQSNPMAPSSFCRLPTHALLVKPPHPPGQHPASPQPPLDPLPAACPLMRPPPLARWPVHVVSLMDERRPHAVTLLGQDYVVWFDAPAQQWRLFKDRWGHAPVSLHARLHSSSWYVFFRRGCASTRVCGVAAPVSAPGPAWRVASEGPPNSSTTQPAARPTVAAPAFLVAAARPRHPASGPDKDVLAAPRPRCSAPRRGRRCPHRLAPLSEGRLEADGTLACSYQ
jgi:hypothetical protein